MKFVAVMILGFSLNALAQTPTPQGIAPSSGGTQTSAASVKDAKESCKKEGKEGKDLVLCVKEKVK